MVSKVTAWTLERVGIRADWVCLGHDPKLMDTTFDW